MKNGRKCWPVAKCLNTEESMHRYCKKGWAAGIGMLLSTWWLPASYGQAPAEESAGVSPADRIKHVQLIRDDAARQVDVLIDGKLFTAYRYPDNLKKPVLYPVNTAQGTPVTRGFPLEPRAGERADHPHHVGLWFNYGDVNGLDFWNNSEAVPAARKEQYGTVLHQQINRLRSGNDQGVLEVTMEWVGPDGKALLREHTTFIFRGTEHQRSIDRITRLTALAQDVSFKDNKEGLLGIRVARPLENPDDQPATQVEANGEAGKEPVHNQEDVTGRYRSSEGVEGQQVWGTRGKWMNLSGTIGEEKISVAIVDHPDNVGYPTYWHARGYGLFAANPLGQQPMSGGKTALNFRLPAGASVTFKHRILINTGATLTDQQLDEVSDRFAGT